MKEETLTLNNSSNLSERLLRRKRSYISLKYWLGWAGGYTNTKNKQEESL
ncbi:hypothetical protein B0O79_1743 [Flavobacteriaceae bacterium MAR_2009_75]|nr:hypothetical protein B0O79_1743 [Flavobacteriaceae bacterium MAR_2009_75]